ncbi:hypothetical protein [Lactococcus ileimucosae]|uniref:hypothetical protein n=1 Tax=Lactococcus ileimucosae TaxID=2941329 RepID=UPI0035148F6B
MLVKSLFLVGGTHSIPKDSLPQLDDQEVMIMPKPIADTTVGLEHTLGNTDVAQLFLLITFPMPEL